MPSLIRQAEVTELTSYRRSAIHQRIDPTHERYDPTFPKPIKTSGSITNLWVREEVIEWVEAQISMSRKHLS